MVYPPTGCRAPGRSAYSIDRISASETRTERLDPDARRPKPATMRPIPAILFTGALLLASCSTNEDPKNNTPKPGPEKSQSQTPSSGMMTVDLELERVP